MKMSALLLLLVLASMAFPHGNNAWRPDYSPYSEDTYSSQHFKIHYASGGVHHENPLYLPIMAQCAETCWARFPRSGWVLPPSDDHRGGDSLFDIYIFADLSQCNEDSAYADPYPQGHSSRMLFDTNSYCAFDLGHMAHEFCHAVEYRYIVYGPPDPCNVGWFYEATAEWMRCIVDTSHKGIWTSNDRDDTISYLACPYRSITADGPDDGNLPYAGGLFAMFLWDYYDSNVLRRMWDMCGRHGGRHMLQDLDSVLRVDYSSSLDNALGHYAIWRYFTGSRDDGLHLREAWRCTAAVVLARHSNYPASGGCTDLRRPRGPGGTDYIEFLTNGNQDLTIDFHGTPGYRWRAYVLGLGGQRGPIPYEHRMILTGDSAGSIRIPAWEITRAVLIPVVMDAVDGPSDTTPMLSFSYSASASDYLPIEEDSVQAVSLGLDLPNPVRTWAKISYQLPRRSRGRLEIVDATGRRIKDLALSGSGHRGSIVWDGFDGGGRRVRPGVYFVALTAPEGTASRKLVLE